MPDIFELRGNGNEKKMNPVQNLPIIENQIVPILTCKHKELPGRSHISLIVSRLIQESAHDEMLNKLQLKLGITKNEIRKLVSDL